MADTGCGTYVYAISRQRVDIAEDGVEDAAVRGVPVGGLVAYVSTVSLETFGTEALRRNLESLPWLEQTARAHDRVVRTIAEHVTTAPVRLATIYRSDEAMREALSGAQNTVVNVLDHLAGRSEWGVKAYVPRVPSDVEADADSDGVAGAGAGRAYLQRRRQHLREREDELRRAAALGDDLHAVLAVEAVASRRHPPQSPQLSGRDDPMILNGAYLIEDDRWEAFRDRVASLGERGADVEITGPWAAYSFAEIRLDTPVEVSKP